VYLHGWPRVRVVYLHDLALIGRRRSRVLCSLLAYKPTERLRICADEVKARRCSGPTDICVLSTEYLSLVIYFEEWRRKLEAHENYYERGVNIFHLFFKALCASFCYCPYASSFLNLSLSLSLSLAIFASYKLSTVHFKASRSTE
jgi:hypothetical protein